MAVRTFTGVDGTDLPALDAIWATPTGGNSMEVSGNTACGTTLDFCCNYDSGTFADKHFSKAIPHASFANYAGPAIRIQAGANSFYYAVRQNDGTVFAGQCITGTPTDWDSGQTGWTPGGSDDCELAVDPTTSTTILLKRAGVTIATFTSKSALAGGKPGVCSTQVTNSQSILSIETGDVGGGGGGGAVANQNFLLMGVG